jgi:AAA ATPase domain
MNDEQKRTLGLLLPNAIPDPGLIVQRGKLPEQLLAEIVPSDTTKLLVAGQRGMGKTTELRRLSGLLADSEFVAVFLQFGAQPSITHSGLIRAMAEALLLHPASKLDAKAFEHIEEWYMKEELTRVVEESSGGEASLGGNYVVLGAKGKIAHKSSRKSKKTKKVIKDIRELMDRFNQMIQRVRKKSGKRVVFIVDDIDKVQDAPSIENTFIHSSHLIDKIDCPCLFTVPITYATSSYLRIAALPYNGIYRVPAVDLFNQQGQRNTDNFDFMRKVFSLRMPFNPIPQSLQDLVFERSGGVLIDAMRMLRCVCKRAILDPRLVIDEHVIEEEFQRLVDDYKFVFDKTALWQKLSAMCRASDKQIIMTDDALPDLLYKMIVIEYWDKQMWFDLHPAARALYKIHAAVIDDALRTR